MKPVLFKLRQKFIIVLSTKPNYALQSNTILHVCCLRVFKQQKEEVEVKYAVRTSSQHRRYHIDRSRARSQRRDSSMDSIPLFLREL